MLLTRDTAGPGEFSTAIRPPPPILTPSNQLAGLLKVEARRAAVEFAGVAVAEVAEKVRFDLPREERRVHLGDVEARHRAAVQPQRPRGQPEIPAQQRRVPQ